MTQPRNRAQCSSASRSIVSTCHLGAAGANADHNSARLVVCSSKSVVVGHYKTMTIARDLSYSCCYHLTWPMIFSQKISKPTNFPPTLVTITMTSKSKAWRSMTRKRANVRKMPPFFVWLLLGWIDLWTSLVVCWISMTMIANYEKLIDSLQTSREQVGARQSSTPILSFLDE